MSTSADSHSFPKHVAAIDDPAIRADPSGSSPIWMTADRVIPELDFSRTRSRDDKRDERRSCVASITLLSSAEDDAQLLLGEVSRKNAWS